ncbi:hypothetical protein B6U93_00035 [Candidatus Woesearchaeota archaeon ex4484_78]|nr:MAG: hypothetical protein B6U93_00035 [Candidatus Woesearchaeota archaeon ex4484_78]
MREFLRFKELQTLSKNVIERLQNLRFRAVVRYLLPETRFYKKLFKDFGVDPFKLGSVYDWQKSGLPLIKKSVYMKNPKDFVVIPDKADVFSNYLSFLKSQQEFGQMLDLVLSFDKERILKHYYSPKMVVFSGGTESGSPTPVFITAKEKANMLSLLKIIGELLVKNFFKGEKTVGLNLFPYGPHLAWHAVHHALDINVDLNLCTAAGGAVSSERLVLLADKFKPNVICGMNDYLRNRWLPLAVKRKISLPKRVVFVNGAQKLCDAEIKQIKGLAKKLGVRDCSVLDFYGASELKEDILPECRHKSGFHHIAPLSNIIKTVSVQGNNKEFITDWKFEDNGFAVIWNIDGAGTLLHGYLLGDFYEKVVFNKCPFCKLNTLRLYNVSRIRDVQAQLRLTGLVEEKVKGSRVNLVKLREVALSVKGVKEAQVVLDKTGKKDSLVLYVVSDKPVLSRLRQLFASAEVKPEIKIVSLKKILGKKFKFEGVVVRK